MNDLITIELILVAYFVIGCLVGALVIIERFSKGNKVMASIGVGLIYGALWLPAFLIAGVRAIIKEIQSGS